MAQQESLTRFGILDKEIEPPSPAVEEGAIDLKVEVQGLVNATRVFCDRVRAIVRTHGFQAVADQFGGEGDEELILAYHLARIIVQQVGGQGVPNMRTRTEIDAAKEAGPEPKD